MDYPLENLSPEKFQLLCQALMTREMPSVQCFPIAQPDGGRDAVLYFPNRPNHTFVVYQIKFLRNPQSVEDPHKWLNDIMKEEAPKVAKLLPRGAKQYVLITNIPGTSHLDVGSMDVMNEILRNSLSIPATAWWRNDINRRLDNAWDLKWVYSELMIGPDLIRYVLDTGLTDNKERRSAAIRAYIKDQFDKDLEVRFKQVDLQNNLLDLFIDIPLTPPENSPYRKLRRSPVDYYKAVHHDFIRKSNANGNAYNEDESFLDAEHRYVFTHSNEESLVGAAYFLLHPLTQSTIKNIVLEGAPGQGKSTITQYLCQIHRIKVLGRLELIASIPNAYKSFPLRLPFRIDLRDLAAWLGKKNPFTSDDEGLPPFWHKSLESFLAAHVRYNSGGSDFSVDDLFAITRISAVLLVFDGLDEVADIGRRQDVVDEILKGTSRLEENTASLQVVVTSRPAAFANSPGLPETIFPYFHLASVTRSLIEQYTEKWLRARRLYDREAAEVKRILREKLDQPHIRDLARNTMQLTILLSLLHTKGSSLPDKRTTLYDTYVDLFFNRESEKSVIVREHRDLLINIHRYLAWFLHAEAESGSEKSHKSYRSGSITSEELQTLLENYLEQEGYNVSLAKMLFTGMVERVVALVSRVEGTYEFEVQPLREYFAARYLYETAPYSPSGNERKGTLPDRFDALARNLYWLNVTRFYAGCYSKGELPSLIDRLQELIGEEGFRLISHPRILGIMLLSDWVFTQHPKSVNQVIELILDGIGLQYIVMGNGRRSGNAGSFFLSDRTGSDVLVARCFQILNSHPPRDYAVDIIELTKENGSADKIKGFWLQYTVNLPKEELYLWTEYGLYLGVLAKMTMEELDSVISRSGDKDMSINCLQLIYRGRRFDYFNAHKEHACLLLQSAMNRDLQHFNNQRISTDIDLFCSIFEPRRYTHSMEHSQSVTLGDIWQHFGTVSRPGYVIDPIEYLCNPEESDKIRRIAGTLEDLSQLTIEQWSTTILPWDQLVEEARVLWGDQWLFFHFANISGGIKSQSETFREFDDLFDHDRSLCKRVRSARLRSGSASWWQQQLEKANTDIEKMFAILVFVTWASPTTINNLALMIGVIVEGLAPSNWTRLKRSTLESIVRWREPGRRNLINPSRLPDEITPRTAALLSSRVHDEDLKVMFNRYFRAYNGNDREILRSCQYAALTIGGIENSDWGTLLPVISKSYAAGIITDAYIKYRSSRRSVDLPLEVAREIAGNPSAFPGFLVSAAEKVCRREVTSKVTPVRQIAERDEWFDEQ